MFRQTLLLTLLLCGVSVHAAPLTVYFGTYTRTGDSKGIYRAAFDTERGSLDEPVLAVEAENPSFLTLDPAGRFLYAVSETPGADEGTVTAYRVLESGDLEKIGSRGSGGQGPCHVSTNAEGTVLAVANYGSGSVASYRMEKEGGLSEKVSVIQHQGGSVNPKRQTGPHAHSVNFSPDGRFVYAADLGTDRIYVYSVDAASGSLQVSAETRIEAGAGPRHFCIRPGGGNAYVINELALSVTAFKRNAADGTLAEIATVSTLPAEAPRDGSTAEVVAHPNGKFLYGSNRGHDTIAVFSLDAGGKPTRLENEAIRGETPRNFALTPDGRWLLAAGQKSNTVTVFRVDPVTGLLDYADSKIEIGSPVCIRFR